MTEPTFSPAFTEDELIAVHRAAAFFADAFQSAGIDLDHVELPSGEIGVSPLLLGVAKLEALACPTKPGLQLVTGGAS